MPRAVTLGNGKILVGLDSRAQVCDFYFPYVALENHISNQWEHAREFHSIGVFVDGELHWLNNGHFSVQVTCDPETSKSHVRARNEYLGITLSIHDIVYNELNIFVREVRVHNERDHERQIKIYFSQIFHISESKRGDTAYYDPRCGAIIHYKGKRVFLVNAMRGSKPFSDYSVGLFEIEGHVGTYADAEDGELERNPIEHGSVDSVIELPFELAGNESESAHYWIAAATSIHGAHELNSYVKRKAPQHLMKTTADFWHAWVNRQQFSFYGLNDDIVDAFKQSLIIIRAHADNRGAIIASSDSDMLQRGRDTYGYMWPRDGALTALALAKAGDFNISRRFFSFCKEVLTEDGYFMHKYRPDGSLGSSWHPWIRNGEPALPIQEDETAIVLYTLWHHYLITKDLEFIEELYNPLILKSANFLTQYMDEQTGLSYPSYDLWEERYGISTYTCSVKYAALEAAANIASLLGKEEDARRFRTVSRKLQAGIMEQLYDGTTGMFSKNFEHDGESYQRDNTLDMSSFHGVVNYGVADPADERVRTAFETVNAQLRLQSGIGGVPRYENDMYYRVGVGNEVPPNPWFITTLWLAQYHIKAAQEPDDLEPAKEWLSWAVRHAMESGVMSEQLHPYTGQQLSAAPLTWSHAEFVMTVIEYLERLEAMGVCEACNPVY
jgi:GH15 family glucan-1,4-alpha-glucosidase